MIFILIGTKAQLVKMAPVMQELSARDIPYKFVLTGQHSETMSDLIGAFSIKNADEMLVERGEADTQLKLMRWLVLAVKASVSRRKIFSGARAILVHGDTMSTLFGAVVGKLYGIPVCHVEAGLRSHNYLNPFPEEIIRVITAYLSNVHYCSSEWAAGNLKRFMSRSKVINTRANTIIDSLRYATRDVGSDGDMYAGGEKESYAVFSMHRHENLSNAAIFEKIMMSLVRISEHVPIKFVLHPVTKHKLVNTKWHKKLIAIDNIHLCERMDYVSFARFLFNSKFLITDGGSNQEESFLMGLPCLLLRKKTERMEGLGDNVVISNYNDEVIDKFVADNADGNWKRKTIPEIYPSKLIVDHIDSKFI